MRKIVILCILCVSGFSTARSQATHNVYCPIPVAARHRLKTRIADQNRLMAQGRWFELFDLQYLSGAERDKRAEKRKEFIELMTAHGPYSFYEFAPRKIEQATEQGKGAFLLLGCVSYQTENFGRSSFNEILIAWLIDDEWYFSNWGDVAQDGSCDVSQLKK